MKRTNKVIYTLVLVLLFQMISSSTYTTTAVAASPTIASIDYQFAVVRQGQKYSLPKKVKATMSDNTTKDVSVTWKKKNINTSKYSFHFYYGTVKGYSKKVKLGLCVGDKYDVIAYNKVKDIAKTFIKPEMTDFEKELAVYDYLLSLSYPFDDEIPYNLREANEYVVIDDVVVLGESRHYSQVFTMFMRVVGINCKFVFCKENGHMWNMVELDKKFYHVDVALDAQGKYGDYAYFNVRDSVMEKIVSWDRKKYPKCNSVKYSYEYAIFNKENNLNYDSVQYCYGTISLPKGKVTPKGGMKVVIEAKDDKKTKDVNDDVFYTTFIEIPEGKTSFDYKLELGPSTNGYTVQYRLENLVEDYIQYGYFSSQGTVYASGEAEMIKGEGSSKADFNIQEGAIVIEGKLSIPKSDATPKEDIEVSINIYDDNKTPNDMSDDYWPRISVRILAGKRVGTFRAQLPPSDTGYRVGYYNSNNSTYTTHGVYGANGMTEYGEPKLLLESTKVDLTLVRDE